MNLLIGTGSDKSQLALMCCVIAIFALQIARFNTVVASRIADLMLLPIAYVIGKLPIIFYKQQRTFFWLLVAILLAYTRSTWLCDLKFASAATHAYGGLRR